MATHDIFCVSVLLGLLGIGLALICISLRERSVPKERKPEKGTPAKASLRFTG
jgi:hypothetical protein